MVLVTVTDACRLVIQHKTATALKLANQPVHTLLGKAIKSASHSLAGQDHSLYGPRLNLPNRELGADM